MASHRHHLPRTQRPHTHLATKIGRHSWGPRPGTPRTHAHPPHPPPGARSSSSTTRRTHLGVMGIHHTDEPTSSVGHQDRTIHQASPDPNPTPQHLTRLHHLVAISGPRRPHPPTSPAPPPRYQHHRPPPGRGSSSHPGRGPLGLEPTIPGRDKSGTARKSPRKTPSAETAPCPAQTGHDELAVQYIIPHTTNRKNDTPKITVSRHLPHTTQVYQLRAPNVLVTHRREDE